MKLKLQYNNLTSLWLNYYMIVD